MKVIKPVLDYLGLGPDAPDVPARQMTTRSPWWHSLITISMLVVIIVLSFAVGWQRRGHAVPKFAERPIMRTSEVVATLHSVGVTCSEDLEIADRPNGTWAICRGTPRFDLHVSNSVEASYESFDLATLVGCYTVGNVPHTQWYVVRENNWNLLTHDQGLADDLMRLRGVTLTTGACDVAVTGRFV